MSGTWNTHHQSSQERSTEWKPAGWMAKIIPGQEIRIQPVDSLWPVEQPRLFSAGQSVHEFLRFRSNGSILVQGPGKVPLLLSSLSDCIAVHNGLQVGVNPGTKDDKQWRVIQVRKCWRRTQHAGHAHTCSFLNGRNAVMDRRELVQRDGDGRTNGLGANVALWTHLLFFGSFINSLNQPVVSVLQSSNPLLQAKEMALIWLYLHRDTTTKRKDYRATHSRE